MDRPAPDSPALVDTTAGTLRGRWEEGVARFVGIPYAAPPVGERRWRPPAPVEPWDGERPAEHPGPISPQNPSMMDALFGAQAERWDEDCLYLNVWTPSPERAEGGLPVMVWIHGGGFEMGSGSSPLYHGTHFARHDVVLVTLNYRLGSLGFLDLSEIDASYAGSGNCGLLDQVAALEWVRDNIASFGGDPSNVTVFGQSAGAMSTALLLTMPRARGLFRRAVCLSGAAAAARSVELARADTREFMETGGWTSMADLQAADVPALLAAHGKVGGGRIADPEGVIQRTGNPLAFLSFRPVADGIDVPTDPLGAIRGGCAAGVELLAGSTSEEWKLFALMSPGAQDEEGLLRRMSLVATDPHDALATYRTEHPDASPADLEGAFLTDLVFRIPCVELCDAQAPHAPTYQYLWTWQSPAWGGMVGAAHAVDVPFVFDLVEDHRLHVFVGPEAPVQLARVTNELLRTFAATGVPTAEGAPELPTVDSPGRPVLVLDAESVLAHDPLPLTRAWWSTPAAARPTFTTAER